MLDPIQELMDKHRIIEKFLTSPPAAQQEVSLDSYEQAGDFIANFTDKCHHGKGLSRHRPFVFPLLKIVHLLESAAGVRSSDR